MSSKYLSPSNKCLFCGYKTCMSGNYGCARHGLQLHASDCKWIEGHPCTTKCGMHINCIKNDIRTQFLCTCTK